MTVSTNHNLFEEKGVRARGNLLCVLFLALLLLITFIQRCSPLSSRLTALACDST